MIVLESEPSRDVAALDEAWSRDETFAFLPERVSVDIPALEATLERLPEDLQQGCFALLTSGTTGRPKLILGEKRRADALAEALHELQASEAVNEAIVALPLSYCYAFVNQWRWARRHDRRLVLTRGLGFPDELERHLQAANDAMLCLVGPQVDLLERYFDGRTFPGVIRLHFAGGPFPQERLPLLSKMFPEARVFNNFGCAEAMPRLTLREADAAGEGRNVGHPLPGIELRTDTTGRVLFRSPYGMVAQSEGDNWVRSGSDWIASGDLGEILADGSLRLAGRTGEVFKRYGEKISLPQLRDFIANQWSGQAAFYLEDDPAGQPAHVLVLAPAPEKDTIRAVLKQLRKQFARPHWPLRIESVAAIPLLPNAKVDTRKLSADAQRVVHWQQRV